MIEEHPDLYEAYALTANNRVELLIAQARKFQPEVVVIANEEKYAQLKEALSDLPIKVYAGIDAVCQIVEAGPVDMVLTAMVGYAGLKPTINAIRAKKAIALANKETLVVAGELINQLAQQYRTPILPVEMCIRDRNVPLIGLPTLEVLSVPVLLYHDLPEDALLCPMLDARRMEVYAAVYDRALNVKRAIAADIVDENSYLEFLNEAPVYFYGNGAAKCREKITHPNAHFIDDIHPLAKMMYPLAEKAVAREDYKDVAYFEPFYLKEFVASLPKKSLLE